jgi:hypothetical protein
MLVKYSNYFKDYMKYVVISAVKTDRKGDTSVIRYPFVFPNTFVHSHIARALGLVISFVHPSHSILTTSAGDVNSMDFGGECSGESTSIGIKSAAGDTNLLRMNDYGSGIDKI